MKHTAVVNFQQQVFTFNAAKEPHKHPRHKFYRQNIHLRRHQEDLKPESYRAVQARGTTLSHATAVLYWAPKKRAMSMKFSPPTMLLANLMMTVVP
jgi:hypothetical protein